MLSSRLYSVFVAGAPGLKELMTVGKVWYEADRKMGGGEPVWQRVFVDAGASGHSLQYLQMPSAAAATFRSPGCDAGELVLEEVPDIDYRDIGGLGPQIEEIKVTVIGVLAAVVRAGLERAPVGLEDELALAVARERAHDDQGRARPALRP